MTILKIKSLWKLCCFLKETYKASQANCLTFSFFFFSFIGLTSLIECQTGLHHLIHNFFQLLHCYRILAGSFWGKNRKLPFTGQKLTLIQTKLNDALNAKWHDKTFCIVPYNNVYTGLEITPSILYTIINIL